MTTSHPGRPWLRRLLVAALLVGPMASVWPTSARADESVTYEHQYDYEYYYAWYRGRCGRWHRGLFRRPVRQTVVVRPAQPEPQATPVPTEQPEPEAEPEPQSEPEPEPEANPSLPPYVRVAVSETARQPGLEGFPIAVQIEALGASGQPDDAFRSALEATVHAGGLAIASPGDAGLAVNATARAHVVRELGAGRTQVDVLGQVEVGVVAGTRPLHVASLRAAGDADSTEATATRTGLETVGREAGTAIVETIRQHVGSIRVREIHIATDDPDLTPAALALPLLEGLSTESHVLAVRQAGTGRGGIAGRGPSVRVEVWLAPAFDDSLAEVVKSVLFASEEAAEVEYEIGSVK